MNWNEEQLMDKAVDAMRNTTLTPAEVADSTERVRGRLHAAGFSAPAEHSQSKAEPVDWTPPVWGRTAPEAARSFWQRPFFQWIPVCAVLALLCLAYRVFWQVPAGVRAQVQSLDGAVYRVSDTGEQSLAAGDRLAEGDRVRTAGGGHAMLRLADGSSVEMNERSLLGVAARGRNVTLALEDGDLMVQAARRDAGLLYVRTVDLRVAVTGTVFAVDAGMKGTRVGVIEGAVDVRHAGADSILKAGEQMSSSDNLLAEPLTQQIGWSRDRAKYGLLLAQLAGLGHRLEQLPFPQPRFSSDLLGRVPANTLLYVSVPNLGEFLSEANGLLQDQLQQSPELQAWLNRGGSDRSGELNSLISRLHAMSGYLGDEVVVVGLEPDGPGAKRPRQADGPDFAVVADLRRPGLDDFLTRQFAPNAGAPGMTVLTEETLPHAEGRPGGSYALVRRNEVVISGSLATLRLIDRQLYAGQSGFAGGDFGQQISAAYGRGAGVIVAADLHRMVERAAVSSGDAATGAVPSHGGFGSVQYLLVEHRELNGAPENHLNVQFAGTRQQVASWLGAPAPIGSLQFVSPEAAVAIAMLSKDPKAIADDLLTMAATGRPTPGQGQTQPSGAPDVSLRDDLAANLGGDFLVALDGPVLPTPAWKMVIEVKDADRLERTLERFAQASQGGPKALRIDASQGNGQRFYAVLNTKTGLKLAEYTFADGYLVAAPDRALVLQALHTRVSGNSLARSASFKALLPKDENENYSAVAYQNLSPVLTPLLAELDSPMAAALRQIAVDARPTAICAWGKDNRIEAASNSHLLGFDLLTFAALLNGNKAGHTSVRE